MMNTGKVLERYRMDTGEVRERCGRSMGEIREKYEMDAGKLPCPHYKCLNTLPGKLYTMLMQRTKTMRLTPIHTQMLDDIYCGVPESTTESDCG